MEIRPTILIVDDDPAFRLMLSHLVGGLEYQVLNTHSASNVPFYEMSERDVIFTDIMMPETGGLAVLRTLAKHNSKCSIILMSGSPARLEEAERLAKKLELNILGALHKPFRLEDVKQVLNRT